LFYSAKAVSQEPHLSFVEIKVTLRFTVGDKTTGSFSVPIDRGTGTPSFPFGMELAARKRAVEQVVSTTLQIKRPDMVTLLIPLPLILHEIRA
jgi:hypothetical protein